MEVPLKERLTGALIVIVALVIVVPEMFSGAGKSKMPAIAPSDGGPPMRTYSLELGSPAAPQNQSTLAPVTPTPAPAVVPPPMSALPASALPVANPPTATATPAANTSPEPAALPPPDVKPNVPPVPNPKQVWWTQLGSFSARENADRLARALRDKGYTIDVARIKVGGKDLYRVRAGPVANREAAVALQSRLAAVGHKSSIMAP